MKLRSPSVGVAHWLVAMAIPIAAWLATLDAWGRGPAEVYVWAARALRSHEFGPAVYDDDVVRREILRLTDGRVGDILSPSPPTLPLFALPFTLLPERWIAPAWAAGNIIALLAALILTLNAVRWPVHRLPLAGCAAAGLLLCAPLHENLARGQIYLWLLAFFSVSVYGLASGRDRLAGIGLGMSLLLKVAGWPVWLVLVVHQRWRALAWAAGSVVAISLLSLPWIGLSTWQRYATDVVPRWVTTPFAAIPAYQTVSGFWQHLFRYDGQWNPAPLADLPLAAAFLAALTVLALLGATVVLARRSVLLLAVSGALVVGVVTSPVAEQYHYLTVSIPFAFLLHSWTGQSDRWIGAALVVAAVLLFAPLPYKHPDLSAGTASLLAYPRLLGALLLWCSLFRVSRAEPVAPVL